MLAADAIFTNGNLITLDTAHRTATAIAVRAGRIVYVGEDAGAIALAGPQTRQVDFQRKTVVPGFHDAHLHLFWYGSLMLQQADLTGTATMDDILSRLSEHAAHTEGWIQGRGWDQDKLTERRFPTRADLDTVSTTRPILIVRVCGHAAVANSAALALLTDEERALGDAGSGLYTETAIAALRKYVPALSEIEAEEAVSRAMNAALAQGFTSVQTMLDTADQMGAYLRLNRKGKLPPLRITAMPPHRAAVSSLADNGIATGFGDKRLRYGGAKLFSDGSLGARTALMQAPYSDDPAHPDNLGIRIYAPDDLKARVRDAQAKGWQMVIHAIGDQAVRETLDAIEYALDNDDQDNTYHRHRIEHASILPPDLLERMAQRKIVAVVQPQFVTSDIWTGERVGEKRAKGAYPFKQMLDAGIPLALSSDCPVEKLDPFACLAAAIFRHPWSPEECLSAEEALHAYCLGSAYAGNTETELGSLTVGKLADFITLSDDPTTCHSAEALRTLKTEAVYISGDLVTVK